MSTSKVKIGVLTYGNTHRNPAILFKQIVTVDQMSGGRVIFGIGTGWHESEHAAYGVRLPSAGDRVRMLEETLAMFRQSETNDADDLSRAVLPTWRMRRSGRNRLTGGFRF